VRVAAVGTRVAIVLAAPDDNIPPGKGPEWGKAAPIGLLIILLLGLALFFLIKNMNKQFRKVPDSFDPPVDEVEEPGAGEDDAAEVDGSETVADDAPPEDPLHRVEARPDDVTGTAGRGAAS